MVTGRTCPTSRAHRREPAWTTLGPWPPDRPPRDDWDWNEMNIHRAPTSHCDVARSSPAWYWRRHHQAPAPRIDVVEISENLSGQTADNVHHGIKPATVAHGKNQLLYARNRACSTILVDKGIETARPSIEYRFVPTNRACKVCSKSSARITRSRMRSRSGFAPDGVSIGGQSTSAVPNRPRAWSQHRLSGNRSFAPPNPTLPGLPVRDVEETTRNRADRDWRRDTPSGGLRKSIRAAPYPEGHALRSWERLQPFGNPSADRKLHTVSDAAFAVIRYQAALLATLVFGYLLDLPARSTSFWVRPPALCVVRSMVTLFHALDQSGWWPMTSAASATWVIKPNACEKSRNSKTRWSFEFSTVQPFSFLSSAAIVCSSNFVVRMAVTSAKFHECWTAISSETHLLSWHAQACDYRAALAEGAMAFVVEPSNRFL